MDINCTFGAKGFALGRIVFVGGGIVGLCGALLLARDGHDVTVLERDPAPPPFPADRAWTDWERRGVTQFRLPHIFQPRFKELMDANAPEIMSALADAGALLINPLRYAHPLLTGGYRESDERYDAYTARRPVSEAAIANLAATTDGITVRRGVAVVGLLTGDRSPDGIPHVIGVRTDSGEDVFADVVIDAAGRRSALPTRLEDIGPRAPIAHKDPGGFMYLCRHFRSGDGSVPQTIGPPTMEHASHTVLTLPADNGTWGLAIVISGSDVALRGLKETENWTTAIKGHALAAHWLEGDPIDDGVSVMAKIEDEHRTFVVDGAPVATGVLAFADSWAVTNPTLGRGIAMGAMHGVALRDLLHDAPSDPVELTLGWHDATAQSVEPWFEETTALDDGRLQQVHAEIAGRRFEPSLQYALKEHLWGSSNKDPDALRYLLENVSVFTPQAELFARPGVRELVLELGSGWREERLPGLTHEELLAIVD